jgi:hypothetical protein
MYMANYIKSLTTPEAETYQIKEDPSIHYATCSTAAATADKTISLDGFVLETGSWIAVRFNTTNTAAVANLTMNVNSTGAKGIKYRNVDLSSAGILAAGRTYLMVYDGTYWQITGDIADKLQTARTINVGTAVTGTATSFDGSANITIPVTGLKEAYLTWGGKDFTQSFSPLDAALEPRLGANRLEMCPGSGIKIERTTDGGTTWTEVPTSSISNAQRSTLFSSSSGYNVPVSATSTAGMGDNAAKYMMRITLDTSVANVYTNLLKFIFNVSTNGCANCYVKLRIRTAANVTAGNDTWLTWDKTNKSWSSSPTEANTRCPIGGWSGYNVINLNTFTTYGNNTSQYRNIQFIFGCTKNGSTSTGLSIINIQGYGGVAWNAPSNMARTGHLYSWNGTGAATFPSTVTATNFSGKLNGMTITGTADSSYNLNDFLTEHPTITKSADTTSTASPSHDGTFTCIDSVTRETNGHVTKINTKTVTLPAQYVHPTYTSKTSGLYKITVDGTGHVSATAAVAKGDIPALDYVPNTSAGVSAAINLLSTGTSTPSLNDYYVSQYAAGGTTTTSYHRRPLSALWTLFKSLITVTTTGTGNAITAASISDDGNNRKITFTKGLTFSLSDHTHDYSKVSFTRSLTSGTKIGTIVIDGTSTDLYCETNTNTDTKVNVTLATTTKAYLLGTSTTPTSTAQAVTSVADTGVYLDTTAGGLCATNVKASSTVCANTSNSSAAGGISLYSTDPETYGIMFRGTTNSGKHGYVQSDWATYFTMNQGATTRGWIFRKKTDGPVASISGAGNAVFNGSVTVGGNSANTSGCRMTYNATTQSLDFVFA